VAIKRRRSSRITAIWAAAIAPGYLFAFSTPANSETKELGYGSSSQSGENLEQLQIGEEFQPCEDCPTFVRVPDAPEEMRRIRFVSKYELTWRNYIAAVQDGSCEISNPKWPRNHFGEADRRGSLARIDMLKVDWPITVLAPHEIDCYINWLKEKTSIKATLPSFDEWRWFATSGRPSVLYPWGDDPAKAAEWLRNPEPNLPNLEGLLKYSLVMIDVAEDLRASDAGVKYPDGRKSIKFYSRTLDFFKVGQFPPSPWGLHDLMGNASELTSDVEPFVGSDGIARPRYTTAGSGFYHREWAREGVNLKRGASAATTGTGHFFASVGVRLVLVE
jgi:formylglycine-generating enzyme required for sulfatase activity